ncbi:MAG: type II toxin-antitoxin system HicB family antitoxin [Candidatus Velthaea sp.]
MPLTAVAIRAEVTRRKAMPYTRELVKNSDGTWFARILELPGCMTEGQSEVEVLTMLEDAMDAWISAKVEDDEHIPDPIAQEGFSGKFMVRAPRSLHRDLARRAEAEGVSLNQWVTTTLARSIH